MKRFFASFCALFLLLFLLPSLALTSGQAPLLQGQDAGEETYYLVEDAETGEVMKLSPLTYIKGVVAAEMPLSYHTEALKAQAVRRIPMRCTASAKSSPAGTGRGRPISPQTPPNARAISTRRGAGSSGAASSMPMRPS